MFKPLGLLATMLTASALWASPGYATSEIYTISGTGSGSLDGTAFNNSSFVFTLTGDPATLQVLGLTSQIDPLISATVAINGFSPVTLNLPTRLGENNVSVFLSRSSIGFDLFDFMLGSQVDLASNFGPVTGTSVSALNQFVDVTTSGGNLTFNQSSNVQFSGIIAGSVAGVPEPSTWALMLIGFGAAGLAIRRSRTKQAPQLA